MPVSNELVIALAGSAGVGAAIKAFFDWLRFKPKPKTAAEQEGDAVHILEDVIGQLRDENRRLAERVEGLDGELSASREKLSAVREEVHSVNNKLTRLLSWVRLVLGPYIAALHAQIRRLGEEPAPMPPVPDLNEAA